VALDESTVKKMKRAFGKRKCNKCRGEANRMLNGKFFCFECAPTLEHGNREALLRMSVGTVRPKAYRVERELEKEVEYDRQSFYQRD
jgi:hypothetical protein